MENIRVAIRRFHSLFTPFGACDLNKESHVLEGCFSSFPDGTCVLSVSIACVETNHKYLAFDVSLPPELLSLKSQSDRLGDK